VTADFLEGVAGAILEFDVEEWEAAVDSDEVRETVETDAQESIELLLPAEPAMVVQGPGGTEKLDTSPTIEEIERAVGEVS
jgi:hypothetical protein